MAQLRSLGLRTGVYGSVSGSGSHQSWLLNCLAMAGADHHDLYFKFNAVSWTPHGGSLTGWQLRQGGGGGAVPREEQTTPHAVRGLRSKQAPKWKLLQSDVAWLNTILCRHFLLVIFLHSISLGEHVARGQPGTWNELDADAERRTGAIKWNYTHLHNRRTMISSCICVCVCACASVIMSKFGPNGVTSKSHFVHDRRWPPG